MASFCNRFKGFGVLTSSIFAIFYLLGRVALTKQCERYRKGKGCHTPWCRRGAHLASVAHWACITQSLSVTFPAAKQSLGRYSFPVPLRVGGCVNTGRAWRRVTSMVWPMTLSMCKLPLPCYTVKRCKKVDKQCGISTAWGMQLEMWANAQHDGRPSEYRWRPLFNATKFGWRPLLDAVQ